MKIGRRHLIREQLNSIGRRLWLSVLPTLGNIKRRLAGRTPGLRLGPDALELGMGG